MKQMIRSINDKVDKNLYTNPDTVSIVLEKPPNSNSTCNDMWKSILLRLFILTCFITLINGNDNITIPVTNNVEENVIKNSSGRIVNGTAAFLGQFPQQVSLRRRYSQSHFCGGNILTSKWILTAGHCMFALKTGELLEPYTIIVIAGEIVLKHTSYARQWSYVSKIIVHPEYDKYTLHNDLALLQLKKPFKIDEYARPIPLAKVPMRPGTFCQVSGWGYQEYKGMVVSGRLLYIDIPLVSRRLCQKLLENITTVEEGRLCAGYMEGQRDACEGDSGGGLLCNGLLTGVVSGGEGCAWPKIPGWYSDVMFYTPWINKYVDFSSDFSRLTSRNTATTLLLSIHFLILALGIVYAA